MAASTSILGPFVGHTTDSSTKIWLRNKDGGKAIVRLFKDGNQDGRDQTIEFTKDNLWAALASFSDLLPDTEYTYQILKESSDETLVKLGSDYQKVRTMPRDFDWQKYRYDFLLMSCNNPDESIDKKTGRDGYEVWEAIPSVIRSHENGKREARVLFALMGGDQIYADAWRMKLLESKTEEEKIEIYFEVYEHYWSDSRYRQVLASLPAYLMWDDHDIMDGWGSETTSFTEDDVGKPTTTFKPEWKSMFVAAKRAFHFYQAARNPEPLSPYSNETTDTFDVGFRVGPIGFILADLRSNRNWQAKVFWTNDQIRNVENWINANREEIEVLFFLTPVVVAHGSPLIEEGLVKNWDLVLKFFKHSRESQRKITKKGIKILKWCVLFLLAIIVAGLTVGAVFGNIWVRIGVVAAPFVTTYIFWRWLKAIKRADLLKQIELIRADKGSSTLLGWFLHFIGIFLPPDTLDAFDNKAGDLSDDIRDSWGGDGNQESTERLLQFLFDLQNDSNEEKCVHVAILSGDIHAGGYSNLYSSQNKHKSRPVIPHIVSSPVGYSPFPWFAEAFYRKYSAGSVMLGSSKSFYAQNSHHFTERNVVICSVRKFDEEKLILKAKFYVEGFSEPQTTIFDLDRVSHREDIEWPK